MVKITIKNKKNHVKTIRFDVGEKRSCHSIYFHNMRISNKKIRSFLRYMDDKRFNYLKIDFDFNLYLKDFIRRYDPAFGNFHIAKIETKLYYSPLTQSLCVNQ